MDKIPFSILPEKLLIRFSFIFLGLSELITKRFSFFETKLKQTEFTITAEEYIARSMASMSFLFMILSVSFSYILVKSGHRYLGIFIAALICFFAFIQQIYYPNLKANRKIREIDKNLLSALRTILIQINSGVSLFDVFVYICQSDYGEVSRIFAKMVKKINTGTPQIEALEEMVKNNPSEFFRKSIWQLINGMKAGSNVSKVLNNMIDSLSKEQIIQIETYGSQLNPLAMFYMLIVIIMPSLGVTFLTIISSFFLTSTLDNRYIFVGLFVMVFIFQIIFLGIIKTKRPSLLEE